MNISVITINWNNKDGLRQTIDSVISQSIFNDIEYIVVDGDSNDGSKDVITTYSDKISISVSEKDNGRYNAMNKGVSLAHGDYVLFLNSGDYFHSKTSLKELSENLDSDIIYGDIMVCNGNFTFLKEYVDTINQTYFINESLPHPASLIKRELLVNEPYDEDMDIVSDWKFFFKKICIDNVSYKHVSVCVSDFNMGGISSTNINQLKIEKEKSYIKLAHEFPYKIIVSLTSWKGRINYVHETIETLLKQTVKPDKIYLILSEEEFKDRIVPKSLDIKDDTFEIAWVDKNIKTMKKVLPILPLLEPNDVIINSDDDVLFEKDFIESRLIDYIKYGMMFSISSQPNFNCYGTYFSGCGSLMTRSSLDGYDIFTTNEIIETYEDDWLYSFLHLLNGRRFALCSKYSVPNMEFVHQEVSSKNMGLYNTGKTHLTMRKRVKELVGIEIDDLIDRKMKVKWN